MSKLQKLEGQEELNCPADLVFEFCLARTADIPKICSKHVPNIHPHHQDWVTPGTTRKWDLVLDGKTHTLTEEIEKVDVQNRIVRRKVVEGECLKLYSSLKIVAQVITQGSSSCIMKLTLEYEKVNENVPEPCYLHNFALGVYKDLGRLLGKAN